MIIFLVPYYNGFDRLLATVSSIECLSADFVYQIFVVNNNSCDFDEDIFRKRFQNVIVKSYSETVSMADNWQRSMEILSNYNNYTAWYMLHVGDKVTANFSALVNLLVGQPEADLAIGNSNLMSLDRDHSLLARKNFPNITQILFSNKIQIPKFDRRHFPVFDVVALSSILSNCRVEFLCDVVVERSLDENDATTRVVWFEAAFRAIFFIPFFQLRLFDRYFVVVHLLRLGFGDLYRKFMLKW